MILYLPEVRCGGLGMVMASNGNIL